MTIPYIQVKTGTTMLVRNLAWMAQFVVYKMQFSLRGLVYFVCLISVCRLIKKLLLKELTRAIKCKNLNIYTLGLQLNQKRRISLA